MVSEARSGQAGGLSSCGRLCRWVGGGGRKRNKVSALHKVSKATLHGPNCEREKEHSLEVHPLTLLIGYNMGGPQEENNKIDHKHWHSKASRSCLTTPKCILTHGSCQVQHKYLQWKHIWEAQSQFYHKPYVFYLGQIQLLPGFRSPMRGHRNLPDRP